jgi:hypothetical protein
MNCAHHGNRGADPDSHSWRRSRGFAVAGGNDLFRFPRSPKWLRCVEAWVSRVRLGAPHRVLRGKPGSTAQQIMLIR